MGIKDFIRDITATVSSYSPADIVTILFVALVGSLVIYFTYRFTSDAAIYNRSFNMGNVIVALITAVIMMLISSNIVISLGMVGALSIVRFRTAVKEARDTIFIFWAIVLGLCAGSQNYVMVVISTLFISAVAFLFSLFSRRQGGSFTLIVRSRGAVVGDIEAAVRRQVKKYRIRAVHTEEETVEYVFKLNGSLGRCLALVDALNAMEAVFQADLIEADEIN